MSVEEEGSRARGLSAAIAARWIARAFWKLTDTNHLRLGVAGGAECIAQRSNFAVFKWHPEIERMLKSAD